MITHGVQYFSNNNSIVINTADRTYFGILEVKLVSRFSQHLAGKTFNTTSFFIDIGNCDENRIHANFPFQHQMTYLVNST
jgi:hypothetical protein